MGSMSIMHWLVVLAIVLVLFGAGKLPRVMGDFAKGIKAFKSGMKEEDEPVATVTAPAAQVVTPPAAQVVTPPSAQVTPPSAATAAPVAPSATVADRPREHA
jgi:sec-independent protein translocase protein TatA